MKKKILIGSIIAVALIVLASFSSVVAIEIKNNSKLGKERNIIYVDDDNTQGPWDGTMEHPYQYIMDAIEVVDDWDTIFVFNGWYNENIDLVFHERTRFYLFGENKELTTINGFIDLAWSGITLHLNGFTIMGDLLYDWAGDNCVIENNVLIQGGIYIRDCDSSIICNNTIYSKPLVLQETKHNIIKNNTFFSGGIQIIRSFLDSDEWNSHVIENNTINGKPIHFLKRITDAVVPEDTGQLILTNCHNMTIRNLDISNVETGIQLFQSTDNRIIDCSIHDSNSEGHPLHTPIGIHFYHESHNNIVENTEIKNYDVGIYCEGSGENDILNCLISGSYVGISVVAWDTTIHHNKIINCSYIGIGVWNSRDITLSNNNISGNSEGISIDESIRTIIDKNLIMANEFGITISLCFFTTVKRNNFIQNQEDAHFYFAITRWSRNYWNHPRFLPKIINGIVFSTCWLMYIFLSMFYPNIPEPPLGYERPGINMDLVPAKIPFKI